MRFFSTNVAKALNLETKGIIAEQADADLLVLDKDLNIKTVIAKGRVAVRDGEAVMKGFFLSSKYRGGIQ